MARLRQCVAEERPATSDETRSDGEEYPPGSDNRWGRAVRRATVEEGRPGPRPPRPKELSTGRQTYKSAGHPGVGEHAQKDPGGRMGSPGSSSLARVTNSPWWWLPLTGVPGRRSKDPTGSRQAAS